MFCCIFFISVRPAMPFPYHLHIKCLHCRLSSSINMSLAERNVFGLYLIITMRIESKICCIMFHIFIERIALQFCLSRFPHTFEYCEFRSRLHSCCCSFGILIVIYRQKCQLHNRWTHICMMLHFIWCKLERNESEWITLING